MVSGLGLTRDVDQIQGIGAAGGGAIPVDGGVGEVERRCMASGASGEDGFTVQGIWGGASADGNVDVVVGAVGGAGTLELEELFGWGGSYRGG